MSSNQELRKPTFVKVKDLERARSGYNVYVKVVSADVKDIETRDGQKIRMVDAVVGDQTGVSKAFFKGQNATHIEKGAVIAIRNGLKKYIKNFISLELDIFGRVTKENVEITVSETYNISEHEHKLPERKPRTGPRNYDQGRRDTRPAGRYNNQRPPRRYNDRPPRREGAQDDTRGERPVRAEREGRQVRREDREGRTEDRRDNRQYNNERPQRRDNNRSYDRDFDRRRQNGDNRPQRREQPRYEPRREEPRREEFRERAPIQWSKIDEISPADDKLNLIVKVLAEQLVKGRNRDMIRCTLGDETGLVKAFLNDSPALRVGKSVALFDCEARVVKEHIQIQCRGKVSQARKDVEKVNEKWNLSDKSWVPVDQ